MQVSIVNTAPHELPRYHTAYAAGLDLQANVTEPLVLLPLGRALVPTGIYVALPTGYEAQIRPRSGLAYKYGVTVLNAPGTIDADYRGEIKVLLINLGQEPFTINQGERIAQMVIAAHEQVEWQVVKSLDDTARGAGAFGHTGS